MRFLASPPDDATTLERLADGVGLLGFRDDQLVATIMFHPPESTHGSPWYDRPDVAAFGQFAVRPDLQGRGIGRRLVAHVEDLARQAGAMELACDTSERASDLIERYRRWGFRIVGKAKWDVTNYESIVLSKALVAPESGLGAS